MKTIRKSVFETNSSSSHSVTIWDGPLSDLYEYEGKILTIYPGEYGWEEEHYSSFTDKASYAYTYAVNYDPIQLEVLERVILEHTKARSVKFLQLNNYYKHGYIDHQSVDEASIIFQDEETLKAFLFCSGSSFSTDNDNH